MFAHILKFNPNHDELGRFSTEDSASVGKTMLSWLAKQPRLSMRGVPSESGKYIAVPLKFAVKESDFADEPLPNKVSVPDHVLAPLLKRQKGNSDSAPVEDVKLSTLRNIQGIVAVEHFLKNTRGVGLPTVVRVGGFDYLVDGHHRATKAVVSGKKTLQAHVVVISEPAKKGETMFANVFKGAPLGNKNAAGPHSNSSEPVSIKVKQPPAFVHTFFKSYPTVQKMKEHLKSQTDAHLEKALGFLKGHEDTSSTTLRGVITDELKSRKTTKEETMYANVLKGAPLGNQNAKGKHHHKGQHTDSIPRSPTEQKRHEKDLESDNWHTKTMAKFRDKSNDSLKFIRQDASEAAVAMRGVNPKKEGQYLDEAHYASMELNKRKTHFAKSTTKDDTMKQTDGWAGDLGLVQKKCDPKKKDAPVQKATAPQRDMEKTTGWEGMFGLKK